MRWRDGEGMNVYRVQVAMARAFNAVVLWGAHKQIVFAFVIFGFYVICYACSWVENGSYGRPLPHAHFSISF